MVAFLQKHPHTARPHDNCAKHGVAIQILVNFVDNASLKCQTGSNFSIVRWPAIKHAAYVWIPNVNCMLHIYGDRTKGSRFSL
jgi:hypothetical protein